MIGWSGTFCMLSLISEVLVLPFAKRTLSRLATDSSPAFARRGASFSPAAKPDTLDTPGTPPQDTSNHFSFKPRSPPLNYSDDLQHQNGGGFMVTWSVVLSNSEGTGAAKHHQIQQRVGSQTVGTMHRGTARLTTCIQAWHHLIFTILIRDDLSEIKTAPRIISISKDCSL